MPKGGTSAECRYDEELNEIHIRDKTHLNMATNRSGWEMHNQQATPLPTSITTSNVNTTIITSCSQGAAPSVVAVSKPNSTTTVTTAIVNLPTPSPNGDSEFPAPALNQPPPANQGVLRISSL